MTPFETKMQLDLLHAPKVKYICENYEWIFPQYMDKIPTEKMIDNITVVFEKLKSNIEFFTNLEEEAVKLFDQ